VIAGAYTESDARAAVHRVAFAIHCRFKAGRAVAQSAHALQVSASVRNFKVNNVVGSASLGFRVNLAACYADNQVPASLPTSTTTTAPGHLQLQPDELFRAPVSLLAEAASAARGGTRRFCARCSGAARKV